MSHVRTQLRAAAVAALTGLPTTGANVFTGQAYPRQASQLPFLEISTLEGSQLDGLPALLNRSLVLRVRAVVRSADNTTDLLDQIALEVETVLLAGLAWGSGILLPQAISAAEPEPALTGDTPVAELLMSFDYTVFTQGSAPGVAI